MGDIKIFRLCEGKVSELEGQSVAVEKSLQTLIEQYLPAFLGVRFLETEYSTGKTHRGRIDTLGIDENGCPVIIEYKRDLNENVINQGLFNLDWLLDHKGEFELLVLKKLGEEEAEAIEWTRPRLLCIAGDFTRYDQHAVQQIPRNIELIRYRRYGSDLLLLELVNAVAAEAVEGMSPGNGPKAASKSVSEYLAQADTELRDRFEALRAFLQSLGDDVQMKVLKRYIAFSRIKNFVCVLIHTNTKNLLVYVKVDPATLKLEDGFTRNVTDIGHYGTGDLEITIRSAADLEKAKPLLVQSYEGS